MKPEARAKVILYSLAGHNGFLARRLARSQGIEKEETTETLKYHFKATANTITSMDRYLRRKPR